MKIVKVAVLPVKDGEVVTAVVFLQRRKGSAWEDVEEKHTVKSGTAEASRDVLLEDDERLIIEGRALTQVVVNAEQSSAHEVPVVPPPLPPESVNPVGVQEEGTSTPKSSSFFGKTEIDEEEPAPRGKKK